MLSGKMAGGASDMMTLHPVAQSMMLTTEVDRTPLAKVPGAMALG